MSSRTLLHPPSFPTRRSSDLLDYRVPATQALQYYNSLKAKGVESRLLYFPDENHWILKPQNSRLWYAEFFAWLAKHAGKAPASRKASRRQTKRELAR